MFDVDALSFDGDGTLWDHEAAMTVALEAAARWFADNGYRHPGGAVTVEWLTRIRDGIARRTAASVPLAEIRRDAFGEALRRCGGHQRGIQEVLELYMATRRSVLRSFDDVPEALRALARRYPIALVSNGNTLPGQVGLDDCFRVVIHAETVGVSKPDPAIFTRACSRLGIDPARCLHVGDDPFDDVAAGRAVGMPVLWCNRTGARWDPAFGEAPPMVSNLDELRPALLPNR